GLAPEIDGVVYIDEGAADRRTQRPARQEIDAPAPGAFCKVEITDAAGFYLFGHAVPQPDLLFLFFPPPLHSYVPFHGVRTDDSVEKRFHHPADPLQRP